MTLEFRPLRAPRFNTRGITKALRRALEKEGKEHRRLLRYTTATWTGTKPQFTSKTIVSSKQISVITAPRGGFPKSHGGQVTGATKWWYLELGTRIRWALMSKDWRSKTIPGGHLTSGTGQGRVIIAGRRAMTMRNIPARPGIKARNWRAAVIKMRSRQFKGLLQREFELIAKNMVTPASLRR
jgi:hypothetical protein